ADRLSLVVEFAPGQATLRVRHPTLLVDLDRLEASQIEHQAAVAHCMAGRAVAPAAYCEPQFVLAGEVDAVDDVRHPAAPQDDRGATVNHPVPDLACIVVRRIGRAKHLAPHPCL